MKILVVANDFPSPRRPYAGIFVLRQAQALAKLGHQLLVVRPVPHAPPLNERWSVYRSIPDEDTVEDIPVKTVRAYYLPRSIGLEYLHVQTDKRIRRIIGNFRPDVIHAHFLLPAGHLAVQHHVPTVVTAHGADAYEWPWERRGLLNAAAEVIRRAAVVTAVSAFIRDRVGEIAQRSVDVIYNGASEETFFRRDWRAERAALGIEADRFVIAFAGDVIAEKGAFDLLRAARRLQAFRPLVILAGRLGRGSRTAIASLGVDCEALGAISQEKLAEVFGAADVVSLPSYDEGLPASLCEAMLSGRPIVATGVGGIPEIVKDGETGYLVEPGNIDQLTSRLEALATDPDLAQRLGSTALEFASSRLTWAANARQYDAIYEMLAQRSAAAPPERPAQTATP